MSTMARIVVVVLSFNPSDVVARRRRQVGNRAGGWSNTRLIKSRVGALHSDILRRSNYGSLYFKL
jgi:hypothetical protein